VELMTSYARITPHTLHRRLVVAAMQRNGWTLVADDDRIDYRSRKRATRQLWSKENSLSDRDLRVTVYFNDAGHVSGYHDNEGGASTHGYRSGRGRGNSQVMRGPSERAFTPRMCRDLLISNADEHYLGRGDYDPAS
jgi:hypothetical protein